MVVKILKTINGFDNDVLISGKTVELTDAQAKSLISAGFAEDTRATKPSTVTDSNYPLKREKLGEDGRPEKVKGQIVYEFLKLDKEGKALLDADGNPVYGDEE